MLELIEDYEFLLELLVSNFAEGSDSHFKQSFLLKVVEVFYNFQVLFDSFIESLSLFLQMEDDLLFIFDVFQGFMNDLVFLIFE